LHFSLEIMNVLTEQLFNQGHANERVNRKYVLELVEKFKEADQ